MLVSTCPFFVVVVSNFINNMTPCPALSSENYWQAYLSSQHSDLELADHVNILLENNACCSMEIFCDV